MKKMVAKHKRVWLKGLRRKGALQTRGTLCRKEYYYGNNQAMPTVTLERCCLGVLKKEVTGKDDYENEALGRIMLKKVGITKEIQDKLVDMNDEKRWTFERIANWIEKSL